MNIAADKQPDPARIVAVLAQEAHRPVAEVADLYAHAHAELALGAHITKFLHIFAIRNVQDILRRQARDRLGIRHGASPVGAL